MRVGAPRRERHPRSLHLGRNRAAPTVAEKTTLDWRFPYGFLDQGFSTPVRMPSPAGDYCFVFDIENREPLDTRPCATSTRSYCRASLPHPLDTAGPGPLGRPRAAVPPITPEARR